MTLSERERFIIIFLQVMNTEKDNEKTISKLLNYSNILNINIKSDESLLLINDIDEVLLDIIDLQGSHLSTLTKQRDNLK